MARRSIFRKAALDRLASPDQLDQLMQVTEPRGWIALWGLCAMVLFALVWSVVGRIPTTISGSGLLLSASGIHEVATLGGGVVSRVAVRVGDRIEEGDTVAVVDQPHLRLQVEQARERLNALEAARRRRERFARTNEQLETESLDKRRDDLQRRLGVLDERIEWLQQRVRAEEEALALGLLTPERVQNSRQELEAARSERAGVELQLQDNEIARLMLTRETAQSIQEVAQRIRDATEDLAALELQLERNSVTLSPYRGTVREIRADAGQVVAAGQALVTVEMAEAPLQAVIYVPTEGKRIRPGMEARVSPVTVRREEFGFIRGAVTFVSPQPASPESMRRTLGNELLVQQLMGLGASFLVRVRLEDDTTTPSGFRWSSSQGPPGAVESGTAVSVDVVVERQRPIALVLPIFRSAVGAR